MLPLQMPAQTVRLGTFNSSCMTSVWFGVTPVDTLLCLLIRSLSLNEASSVHRMRQGKLGTASQQIKNYSENSTLRSKSSSVSICKRWEQCAFTIRWTLVGGIMNSADVFRIDFLGHWTKLRQLCSNFPQLVKLKVFHFLANHACFHGAEIIDLNCKLLAVLAQECQETFLQTLRAHALCFYSFGTKIVRGTRTVVSLVYDSLLQRTTTFQQQ
jgi:uncharacterized protein VirK/YbjX